MSKSKYYKINVIAHQLKGKKVAKFGEIVSESELTSDASKLVKSGFIVEVSEKEKKALADADAKAKADADAKAKADADAKAKADAASGDSKQSDAVTKAAEKLADKAKN